MYRFTEYVPPSETVIVSESDMVPNPPPEEVADIVTEVGSDEAHE